MKYRILILLILAAAAASCSDADIIPKETMVDIYHDMYLLDQIICHNGDLGRMTDTLKIYEPIFEKYGYDTDQYTASVNWYLNRPEKFGRVFTEVKQRFEKRLQEIDDSIALAREKAVRWTLIDSVRVLGHDTCLTTPLYRALDMMFFVRDTTLLTGYPQPDSSVLDSYKLTVFELYEGNPFSTVRYPTQMLAMLPDTAAKAPADSMKKESLKMKKAKKKPDAERKREIRKSRLSQKDDLQAHKKLRTNSDL